MATKTSHNKNNSAIKRIMQEARELASDPSTDYSAAPLEDDIFEWHCTLRGPPGTEFEGGLYHFRILLPAEYPFRPPSIMLLTPNGRFELNTKICISFTNYHEELWQPAWGVRTAIIGLQGFFPLKGQAAVGVGAIETPVSERKRLAQLSRDWTCPTCGIPNLECLPDPPSSTATDKEPTSSSSSTSTSNTDSLSPPNKSSPPEMIPEDKPPSYQASEDQIRSATEATSPVYLTQSRVSTDDGESTDEEDYGTPVDPQQRILSKDSSTISNASTSPARTASSAHIAVARSSPRPPILLDTAICVLLILVVALMCRKL